MTLSQCEVGVMARRSPREAIGAPVGVLHARRRSCSRTASRTRPLVSAKFGGLVSSRTPRPSRGTLRTDARRNFGIVLFGGYHCGNFSHKETRGVLRTREGLLVKNCSN